LHQVASVRLALDRAHDRRRVCDLDVLARLLGLPSGKRILILISEKPSNSVAAAVSNR
jgi:hypothetical protein